MTRKSIKIEKTERGNKYFTIYEVKAIGYDGEVSVMDRFFDKKKAEEQVEFDYQVYHNLYKSFYIREQLVWC